MDRVALTKKPKQLWEEATHGQMFDAFKRKNIDTDTARVRHQVECPQVRGLVTTLRLNNAKLCGANGRGQGFSSFSLRQNNARSCVDANSCIFLPQRQGS